MKYQIGSFSLNVKARTISHANGCQNIRPKTLALLMYLAHRPEQIISKQELLDNVWDDVAVDEGVIFQSVREIRTLFADAQIIQNFPRKGYQFTAELTPVPEHLVAKKVPLLGVITLAIFALVYAYLLTSTQPEQENDAQQSVLVLPIKSHIPYGENDWLNLGGMEQLINQISSGSEQHYVYQPSHVLGLMQQVGLSSELPSQGAKAVLNSTGASVVVETEIRGNVYDYKLIYKLHTANGVFQGVILDTSIPNALAKLADLVKRWPDGVNGTNDFSQSLLSEAMISYESDWQTSISFFESYLALNPNSIVGIIYLSKLYLWRGELDKADELVTRASKLDTDSAQEAAQITLLQARVAVKKQNWQLAFDKFALAQSYHELHKDWFLKANIEEERGLALVEKCDFSSAIDAFSIANTYYELINSPIGTNSSLLHKANALFQMGDTQLAQLTMQAARDNIDEADVTFLQTMLSKYEAAMASDQNKLCAQSNS